MSQSTKLISTFKKIIKAKGITYIMLAKKLGVSEPTIKRSLTDADTLSLKRLDSLCSAAGTSLSELIRISDLNLDEKQKTLTYDQEEALSLELSLFQIFYLLLRQWTPKQIESHFKIPALELNKIMLKLDKLKLIELHEEGKFKLLTSRNIKWTKNGPLYKVFENELRNNFLSKDFAHANEKFSLLSGTMTETSQMKIKEKMIKFEKEIEDIIESDVFLEKEKTESVVIVLAMSPLMLSIFNNPGK